MKFLKLHTLGETIAASFYDKRRKTVNSYFIQLTLKEPWFKPRIESRFGNGSWVCGWLFFYFGNIKAVEGADL